jgi:hypothetical protein
VKVKTALKQSIVSVKFLAFAIAVMLFLVLKYPSEYTIIPLIVFGVYFCMDLASIRRIQRKAAKDSSYMDSRLK